MSGLPGQIPDYREVKIVTGRLVSLPFLDRPAQRTRRFACPRLLLRRGSRTFRAMSGGWIIKNPIDR